MENKLIEDKLLLNKKGEFCEVVTVNEKLFSYRNLNRPNYIHWVSISEFVDDFYEVDLNNEFVMNIFTNLTNRSINQTNYLVGLLDGDYNKLIDLEAKIKNNFLHYCPTTVEEIDRILSMDNKINDYNFELFKSKEK